MAATLKADLMKRDPDSLVPSAATRSIFGEISDMTLWRWLHDSELGFPRPIYIGKRRFWRYPDLIAFRERMAARSNTTGEAA